jgi:hypothetical protein
MNSGPRVLALYRAILRLGRTWSGEGGQEVPLTCSASSSEAHAQTCTNVKVVRCLRKRSTYSQKQGESSERIRP